MSNTELRIIDANLNRAREALRVMEEYARLGLNDALLSQAIKETRHELATALRECHEPLIFSRDIVGDVGCQNSVESEYNRASAQEVAQASCKRLTEALRAIEEYGKTVEPKFARSIEQIRYKSYELERRLNITANARVRFAGIRLYVIITEALCKGDWFETAQRALKGGAECLQLREKNLTDRALVERATKLAHLCHDYDALFIVNDRPDMAMVSGADGVHLGQDDMSITDARRSISPRMLIGTSTHTIEQVRIAAEQVPDYIAVGPMFATPTKPQDHIAGLETLAAAGGITALPLVAIGGIDATNGTQILQAAPCTLCVCQAVISRDHPEQSTRQLRGLVS